MQLDEQKLIKTGARLMAFLFIPAGVVLFAVVAKGEDWLGPAYARFSLTLETGRGAEALGPLYYQQSTEWGNTFAIPPLFSSFEAPDLSRVEYDIAYPLLTYDRAGTEFRWQLGQLISFAGSQDQNTDLNRRFTLFPFYFQQVSDDPQKTYHALFPIYGQLQGRLFRSRIEFLLWPLYVKTTRHANLTTNYAESPLLGPAHGWLSPRSGEITTYNYLLPFFHLRYGDGLTGWQFWPLLGHELKTVTITTNSWGEAEMNPGHETRFVLWPFFSSTASGLGSDNPEHQWTVVPLYSRLRSPKRDFTSYGWPLGVNIVDDRGKKYHEVDAPWPFVVFAHGEGKTARRIWPLFGSARNEALEDDFYLWPVYKFNRIHAGALDRQRTRLFFFVYSDVIEKNTETGHTKHRTDFWPLFTHRTDFNGNSRWQVLAPLEPYLPGSKSLERNYSPVWSLWRAEANPATESDSQSLLWNLYRRERVGTTKKCSLLFGLFQYHSTASGRQVKIFYLPFGKLGPDEPKTKR